MINATTQKSREIHAEGILKVEKTGCHKQHSFGILLWRITVPNEENDSRWHRRYVVEVQEPASRRIGECPRQTRKSCSVCVTCRVRSCGARNWLGVSGRVSDPCLAAPAPHCPAGVPFIFPFGSQLWIRASFSHLACPVQSEPCRNKTAHGTMHSLQRMLPSEQQAWSCTDTSLEFTKTCEDLLWNHDISTQIDPKRTESPKTAARRVEEGTSTLLVQSGLGRWWREAHECFCYVRKMQELSTSGKLRERR